MLCFLCPAYLLLVHRKTLHFLKYGTVHMKIIFLSERENIFPLLLQPNDPLRSSQGSASKHHFEINECCLQPQNIYLQVGF